MGRLGIAGWIRRARAWLTLDGRLSLAQPWAPALGGLALALSAALPARWLLYTGYVFLLLSLAAYLYVRLVGPRLSLARRLRAGWAQVGDELEEEWALENRGPLPLLWLELDDGSTLPGYSARRVASCGRGATERWRTEARCGRRGLYRLGPLSAGLGDPLGIFRYAWADREARQIAVYPPLVRLPELPLPRGARGGLARADLLQLYATPSVGGLRAYAPGDPPSRIHWPYVARHQELYVKEFDQERAGALWLVLDLAASAYPPAAPAAASDRQAPARPEQSSVVSALPSEARPDSLLELAVTLAASLAARAIAEGRAVGLIGDDGRQRLVPPAGGPRQLWRILDELVDCGAGGGRPLGELLRGGWGREGAGGALVVITPALDGAWLTGLAERGGWRPGGALALLVAAAAGPAAACGALLAARGVPARSFLLGEPMPLLNPPRQRVRARVSPMGRVVGTGQAR